MIINEETVSKYWCAFFFAGAKVLFLSFCIHILNYNCIHILNYNSCDWIVVS